MPKRQYPETPLLAACCAIWRGDEVLLANRSSAPNAGKWAMPGGLVEVGETLEQAVIREVAEETSLRVEAPAFYRFHEIIIPDDHGTTQSHYVLAVFVVQSESGAAVAGDDAAAVEWFALKDLNSVILVDHTLELLRQSLELLER